MIMNIYEQDIFSQPEDMRRALKNYRDNNYTGAITELTKRSISTIIFTGMGSSLCACYNTVTILRNHGIHCFAVAASQLLHYELSSVTADTLVVMVSQSGRSGEIVDLVNKLKGTCYILGISNDPRSPLGLGSDLMLNLFISPEQAVSTRTYLAPVMLLHIFTGIFTGMWKEGSFSEIEAVIDSLDESIGNFESMTAKIEDFLQLPPFISLIGRGYSLSTVHAGALFIKEVAKYPSIAFDAGQFRHGPYEMLGKDFSCIIFAPRDAGFNMQINLARDVSEKGGKVVLVTDGNENDGKNILVISQKYPIYELVDMVNLTPVQAFGNYAAKRKGLEVGAFIHSRKITSVQ
jgi:glucosamine--fructose-6-phosphate aminotransferase (isomerizing)